MVSPMSECQFEPILLVLSRFRLLMGSDNRARSMGRKCSSDIRGRVARLTVAGELGLAFVNRSSSSESASLSSDCSVTLH